MNAMQHTRANSFDGVVHSRRASAITDKSPNHDNHDSYGFWPDGRLLMVADGVSSDPWAKDASEAAVLGALQARGSMGDRFRAAQAHCRKEAPGSGTTRGPASTASGPEAGGAGTGAAAAGAASAAAGAAAAAMVQRRELFRRLSARA